MTGAIRILGAKGVAYKRLREDAQWPPRFTKLLLSLSGGKELALTDPRRFGKVLLRESPEEQPPLSLLAPDPVTDALPLREFVAGLRSARAPVKALLLSQDKLVCGVGARGGVGSRFEVGSRFGVFGRFRWCAAAFQAWDAFQQPRLAEGRPG
ncbi:unnamed protein product, partial [Prorocentrum cordatum]